MGGNLAASNNITLIYLLTQQRTSRNLSKDNLEKEIKNIFISEAIHSRSIYNNKK